MDPALWFHRRLQYTRSVSVGSMIGYVVGLGDRHSMNILIDERSAELIHIDLGIGTLCFCDGAVSSVFLHCDVPCSYLMSHLRL